MTDEADLSVSEPDAAAVAGAMAALDAHMAALNAGDEAALIATLQSA